MKTPYSILDIKKIKDSIKKLFRQLVKIKVIIHYRRKIKELKKVNPKLNANISDVYLKEIKNFWEKELGFKIKKDWHSAYSMVNGINDSRYIPEDIFYSVIEPRLNRMEMAPAYQDKNSYGFFLKGMEEAKTILRNINYSYFTEDYRELTKTEAREILLDFQGDFIIKPSIDTGGGRSVQSGTCMGKDIYLDNKKTEFNLLEDIYINDFLIQEKVRQSTTLKRFHPSSINTIRVTTLRVDDEIVVLSGLVRFGVKGSTIDNQRLGGISCGLSMDGKFNSFAIDKYANKYYEHPDSRLKFEKNYIPNYIEVKNLTKKLHKQLKYFNLVSWDIAIDDEDKLILIELNLRGQGINIHQFSNGALFNKYTKAVCK